MGCGHLRRWLRCYAAAPPGVADADLHHPSARIFAMKTTDDVFVTMRATQFSGPPYSCQIRRGTVIRQG